MTRNFANVTTCAKPPFTVSTENYDFDPTHPAPHRPQITDIQKIRHTTSSMLHDVLHKMLYFVHGLVYSWP